MVLRNWEVSSPYVFLVFRVAAGRECMVEGPASRALASHGIKTFNDFGERNIIASVQLEGEKKRVIPSTGPWEAI